MQYRIILNEIYANLKAIYKIAKVVIKTFCRSVAIEFNFKWERVKLWLKEDSYNFTAVMPYWYETYKNWVFFKNLRYLAIFFLITAYSIYNLIAFYAFIYEYIWDPKDSIYEYIIEYYLLEGAPTMAYAIIEYITEAYIFNSKSWIFRGFVLYILLAQLSWYILLFHVFINIAGRLVYFPDLYIYEDFEDVIVDPKDKYLTNIKDKIIVEDFPKDQDTYEKREVYLENKRKRREEEGEYFQKAWKDLDYKEEHWEETIAEEAAKRFAGTDPKWISKKTKSKKE